MMMTPPSLPLMLPAVEAPGADGLATSVCGTCGRGATGTRASAKAAVTTCGTARRGQRAEDDTAQQFGRERALQPATRVEEFAEVAPDEKRQRAIHIAAPPVGVEGVEP